MNPEKRINTGLEVNILQYGRKKYEAFGNNKVRIIESTPEKAKLVKQYRVLFPGDRRVKVSPDGYIDVSSYRDLRNNQNIEIDRIIDDPSIKTVKRIWTEYQGIPHAIRGVRNIKGEFQSGGLEYENLRIISNLIRNTISRLRVDGGINNLDDMERLTSEAATIMESHGISTGIKPDKLQLKKRLERAFRPTDSIRNFNPSVTRMQLIYALLDTIPLFLFEDKTSEKYGHIEEKLVRRDFMERMNLSLVGDLLIDSHGLSPKNAEYINRMNDLKEFTKSAFSDESVTSLPYRQCSLFVRNAIVGPQNSFEVNLLTGYGIDQEAILSFIGDTPIEYELPSTRSEIMLYCNDLIRKTLDLGARQLEHGI